MFLTITHWYEAQIGDKKQRDSKFQWTNGAEFNHLWGWTNTSDNEKSKEPKVLYRHSKSFYDGEYCAFMDHEEDYAWRAIPCDPKYRSQESSDSKIREIWNQHFLAIYQYKKGNYILWY